jgi:catechol 2,3-dioxygenase-like lactoylglutathione lyase family enzyme
MGAMPGLVGIQHVSSTVRDLGETLGWYRDVLGIEPHMTMQAEGPALGAGLRVPGARLDVAFLRVGGATVELIEYVEPADTRDALELGRSDHGASHICFEVEDIDAAYAHLTAHGVDCYDAPQHVPQGPLTGAWFLYFDGPEGLHYELHQMPPGWEDA